MKNLSIEIVAQEIAHNFITGRVTDKQMENLHYTAIIDCCLDETPVHHGVKHWEVFCDAIVALEGNAAVMDVEIDKLVKARVVQIAAYRTAEAKCWAEDREAAAA